MADETNNTDEKAENQSGSGGAAEKKVAKKRVAKKKSATKKKAVTSKKIEAKKKSTITEAKSGTPTQVAAKVDEAESKAASSNVAIQTKLENKPAEKPPMSTDSKSSNGFWIKVTFWLIVIILGFMYIRSLAKTPVVKASAIAHDTNQAEVSTMSDHSSAAAVEKPVVSAESSTSDTSGYKISFTTEEKEKPQTEAIQPKTTETSEEVVEEVELQSGLTSDSSITSTPVTVIKTTERSAKSTQSQAPETAAQDQQQKASNQHSESVTKILKEFDALREAAQAERDATQKRIQAERDLHEAMMAPGVAPAYRGAPGYSPYRYYGPGPYPQNYYR